jgi:GNAT superfamily N-acetyltransferase
MKTLIEDAKPEDAARLVILLGQLGYPATHSQMLDTIRQHNSPTYKLLVAKQENKTLGFIALHFYNAFHHHAPIGRITAFCVDENARGAGIGSSLIKAAEEFFEQQGCFKIELTSNSKRANTHQYYLHRGYIEGSRHFIKILSKQII